MNNFEERKERDSAYLRFRGSLHIGMGIMYVLIGSLVLYIKHFGAMDLPAELAYVLGSMMLLYGFFRIWRGITYARQRRQSGR